MWFKEEEDNLFGLSPRHDRNYHTAGVRIDLPPPFSGEDDRQSFSCWARQLEVAVRALVEGDGETVLQHELVRILPTRLSKAAFLLWDSLPVTVQSDYKAVKERLKEAFGHKQYLDRFRANLAARPRAAHESLVVYAAEINRLVLEAFPDYGKNAIREEKFRRFLAGLDPGLRAKCHEQGATDMEEALIVAERCENAREAIKLDCHGGAAAYTAPIGGPVAAVHPVTDHGSLHRVVSDLAEEMRDMRMDLKLMAEENQRLRERAKGGVEWRSARSTGRGPCHCMCGGVGCQSQTSHALQRGRSPDRSFNAHRDDRRPFTEPRSHGDPASHWLPGRRSPSPGRPTVNAEEAPRKRGVRFSSPRSEGRSHHQGNGV